MKLAITTIAATLWAGALLAHEMPHRTGPTPEQEAQARAAAQSFYAVEDLFQANYTVLASAGTHDQGLTLEGAAASRAAAEQFYNLDDALKAGFEPLFDCTDSGDKGAMGQHFIKPDWAMDGKLDVAKPDVLMYEPQADGSMHLVALEYIVFQKQWTGNKAPVFLGHELQLKHKVGTHEVDPFYELHVWHWRDNPSGMVADYNPAVTCDHAM